MVFRIISRESPEPEIDKKVSFRITGRENPSLEKSQEMQTHPSGIPTDEERSQMQYPYFTGSAFAQHPIEGLANIPISMIGGLENLGRLISSGETGSPLADYLSKLTGFSDLPEEAKEHLDIGAFAAGFLPGLAPEIGAAAKGLKNLPGKLKSIGTSAGAEIGLPSTLPSGTTGEIGSEFSALGKSIKEGFLGKSLSKTVPEIFTTKELPNTTNSGIALEEAIHTNDATAYKPLDKLYRTSEKLNAAYEQTHAPLMQKLVNKVQEWEKIPAPSAPLQRAINDAKKMISELGESYNGNIVGYRPISNQNLIQQVQEWRKAADFEYPHGSDTGAIKSLISDVTTAIDDTAKSLSSTPQGRKAVASWDKAKSAYSKWAEIFRNPVVDKWRKLTDKAYSKNYLSSLNLDDIRQLTPALELSADGQAQLQILKRRMAEKLLKEYFDLGGKFKKGEISEILSELESIYTQEEIKALKTAFEESRTPGAKLTNILVKLYKAWKRPGSVVKDVNKIT